VWLQLDVNARGKKLSAFPDANFVSFAAWLPEVSERLSSLSVAFNSAKSLCSKLFAARPPDPTAEMFLKNYTPAQEMQIRAANVQFRAKFHPAHAEQMRLSLRANIAETLLVPLITEQGGKEIQREEHEDILSGLGRRAQ
jgi:hypothetical protein